MRRTPPPEADAPSPPPSAADVAPASPALDRLAWGAIALATLALATYALGWRTVGDTAAESDFFGGYAFGTRELLQGRFDFGRYGVFGPVYEGLLALVSFAIPDLFTAARVLSVLSVATLLLAWWGIARRALGSVAALAMVPLLLVNPTLVRYGYSATTDAPGFALFSLTAWALTSRPIRGRAVLAGSLAGLATLTRYNLATLVIAGLLVPAFDRARDRRGRLGAIAAFALGATVVIAPFTLASLAAGHVPGITLLRDRGFYGAADPSLVLENRYRDMSAGIEAAPPEGMAAPPRSVLVRFAHGLLPHVRDDARLLLGVPVALLVAAGVVVLWVRRRGRALWPLLPLAVLTFLPLVPVYYSLRYTQVLLPLYLLPAAALVAEIAHARWPRPARIAVLGALALVVLVPAASGSLRRHEQWWNEQPREARAAGEAIRPLVRPGERLLARKGHTAYFAGLHPVNFPLVDSLESLASFCRAERVDYLFYSPIEARSRPAFAFLLDTTAAVPGLAPLYASDEPPCVVYRIGPGFGATPGWWNDEVVRTRVAARVSVQLEPGPDMGPLLLRLADDELRRHRPLEALRDARAARRVAPGDPEARRIAAAAHRQLGQRDSAIAQLEGARALAPDDPATRLALGALLHEAGRGADAAEAWRPAIESAADPGVLAAMVAVFDSLGDADGARRARVRLAVLRARH